MLLQYYININRIHRYIDIIIYIYNTQYIDIIYTLKQNCVCYEQVHSHV